MPITISGDAPNFTSASATTITGVTTLNASSGVLATQNGMTGIAKSWVTFTGNATPTILNSFNTSSVTLSTTGVWLVAMTTAMPSASYAIVIGSGNNSSTNYSSNKASITNSSNYVVSHYESAALTNLAGSEPMMLAIFSN
jgi:hypothetical protein